RDGRRGNPEVVAVDHARHAEEDHLSEEPGAPEEERLLLSVERPAAPRATRGRDEAKQGEGEQPASLPRELLVEQPQRAGGAVLAATAGRPRRGRPAPWQARP